MNINMIPVEILLPILSSTFDTPKDLARIKSVCSLWKELAETIRFQDLPQNQFFGQYPKKNWRVISTLCHRFRIEYFSKKEESIKTYFDKYLSYNPFKKSYLHTNKETMRIVKWAMGLTWSISELDFDDPTVARLDSPTEWPKFDDIIIEDGRRYIKIGNQAFRQTRDSGEDDFATYEEFFIPLQEENFSGGKIYRYRDAIVVVDIEPILIRMPGVNCVIVRSPPEFLAVINDTVIKKITLNSLGYTESFFMDFKNLEIDENENNFEPKAKKQKLNIMKQYLGVHGPIAAFLFDDGIKIIDLDSKSLLQEIVSYYDVIFSFPWLVMQGDNCSRSGFDIYEFQNNSHSFKNIAQSLYPMFHGHYQGISDSRFYQHDSVPFAMFYNTGTWGVTQNFLVVDSEEADDSLYTVNLRERGHPNKINKTNFRNFSRYLNVTNLETGERTIVDFPLDSVQKWLLWDHRVVLIEKHVLKMLNLFNNKWAEFDLKRLIGSSIRTVPLEMDLVEDGNVGRLELVLRTYRACALNAEKRFQEERRKISLVPDVL